MKPERRRQMMILSGGLLLFQLFLLYYTAPQGILLPPWGPLRWRR